MDINRLSNRTILRILILTGGFIGMIWLVIHLRQPLSWIAVAVFIALALNPLVEMFTPRFGGRGRAVAAVAALTIATISLLSVTLIPPFAHQTRDLWRQLPDIADRSVDSKAPLAEWGRHYDILPKTHDQTFNLETKLGGLGGGNLVPFFRSLLNSVLAFLSILFLSFFMLLEGPHWIRVAKRFVPDRQRDRTARLSAEMYQVVSGYLTGKFLTSLTAALVLSVTLILAGVPFALPLGLLAGLLDLIPLIGATIGSVILISVAVATSAKAAIIVGMVAIVYYIILSGQVLVPMIYSRTLKMSPLLVLIATLLGGFLGGLIGALFAIPVAACLQILLTDYAHHPNR